MEFIWNALRRRDVSEELIIIITSTDDRGILHVLLFHHDGWKVNTDKTKPFGLAGRLFYLIDEQNINGIEQFLYLGSVVPATTRMRFIRFQYETEWNPIRVKRALPLHESLSSIHAFVGPSGYSGLRQI